MSTIQDDAYLGSLLAELERIKLSGKKHLYRFNDKVSPQSRALVEHYFKDNPNYLFEKKYCIQCQGTWDLIITIIAS